MMTAWRRLSAVHRRKPPRVSTTCTGGSHGICGAFPAFAGSPVLDWRQPANDPLDVEADLEDGRKIGLELTSWLDESQIGREKKKSPKRAAFMQPYRKLTVFTDR